MIQVACTTCLDLPLRGGLCRCVARRLRYARTGRARVMPWSDDASVPPGYGVDVVARQRVAQNSRELIPHMFTSDRPTAVGDSPASTRQR